MVEKIAGYASRDVRALIGDTGFLKSLNAADFTDEIFGLPTVTDIISELDKPGRDPRPDFKAAEFKDGIEDICDLKLNMELEGVVTNVTNFGAFVDVGVHQDGLVHISALSENFVKDPREVVKAGDIVKVKVMEVDVARKRVGLSMRMSDKAEERAKTQQQPRQARTESRQVAGNHRKVVIKVLVARSRTQVVRLQICLLMQSNFASNPSIENLILDNVREPLRICFPMFYREMTVMGNSGL